MLEGFLVSDVDLLNAKLVYHIVHLTTVLPLLQQTNIQNHTNVLLTYHFLSRVVLLTDDIQHRI